MDSLCQLSESARPDGIFSILETPDGTLGDSGPRREELCGELFRFRSDFFEIFRVDYSFVLAEGFMGRVQGSRFGHHGEIGPARPACRCLSADEVKLTCDDMPAHKQADCLARACAAIGSTKFGFCSGQKMLDFVFHGLERKPAGRLW